MFRLIAEPCVTESTGILGKFDIGWENTAYIGDDVNDLECMAKCGLSACPSDAMEQVKSSVDYVCKAKGGEGAVRELIDLITDFGARKGMLL